MFIKNKMLTVCLNLFLVLLSVIYCSPKLFSDLEIELKAHKNTLIQGEPLFLQAKVSNAGNNLERIPHWGEEYYSNDSTLGRVYINGNRHNYTMRPPRKPVSMTVPYRLRPNEKITEWFTILFKNVDDYRLQINKQYRIKIMYGNVESNTVQVHVKQPNNEHDKTVWNKHLNEKLKRSYGRLIHAPWQLNTKYSLTQTEREKFVKLIQEYGHSTYAPYLSFSLARNYAAQTTNTDGEKQSKYKAQARDLFDKTLQLTGNRLLQKLAELELKRVDDKKTLKETVWDGNLKEKKERFDD